MKTHEEQIEDLEETIIYYKEVQEKRQLAPYAIRSYLNVCKQKAKELKEEIEKKYRSLKREHCDDCDKEECQTCKPEFDKIRNNIEKLNKIIGSEE